MTFSLENILSILILESEFNNMHNQLNKKNRRQLATFLHVKLMTVNYLLRDEAITETITILYTIVCTIHYI